MSGEMRTRAVAACKAPPLYSFRRTHRLHQEYEAARQGRRHSLLPPLAAPAAAALQCGIAVQHSWLLVPGAT